ncbi:FHA domain-containing protein [Chroococcidiopsis sp. CCNUC1]|jgi:pSer/pThr/pTyr-binding forkhead associated (FHA) protein|uniref:FHA domain-containing protein n=1 Tax=Chroococcidiopsis sp. CCNUC1 TaxID=2653189 RepID=UPI002021C2BD|nr:FHA domain-containing protein [Chroococcidiopsis sp. CCNUC1]URD48721.1 FHA domain-containing protein [Chroococcidiopsis sp. CCNUC1]
MAATCPSCLHENPVGTEFCEVCGSEIGCTSIEAPLPPIPVQITASSDATVATEIQPPIPQPAPPVPHPSPTITNSSSATNGVDNAKLISKQAGASISEFILDGNNVVVGRFDPDTGPVDLDLEGFSGDETISRNHAEIYYEGNQWKIKDLGSTNGVFIKRYGQRQFGARITIPEMMISGDEIAFGKIRFLFQA